MTWRLAYSTTFQQPAALGQFSQNDPSAHLLSGLPADVRWQWWAYPAGWPDTATQRNYPVGGYYDPEHCAWISGGQMHIRMFRGTGSVHSCAVVPRVAMNRRYGRYVETSRVVTPAKQATGYKSAHLLWPHGDSTAFEVDYPEAEWDTRPQAYVHYGNDASQVNYDSGVTWQGWHTYETQWIPGKLTFLIDNRVIGSTARGVPDIPMDWIIQNESALNGESAPVNSAAQMDIKKVVYYAWT